MLSFVTAQCLGVVLATMTILAQSPKLDTPASSDEPTSITAEMILDMSNELGPQ